MLLILIAISPVLIIGIFFYIKDKYEKEPLGQLLKSILIGGIAALAAIPCGIYLYETISFNSTIHQSLYEAFVLAGFNEETWKLIAFFILVWYNKNFNENFDGIIYSVFISLGFAGVENILYAMDGGIGTGLIRAFTAVPAHALDGVAMGYFLSKAKFGNKNKARFLMFAWIVPVLLHGIWDMLIYSIQKAYHIGFSISLIIWLYIGFLFFLWHFGLSQMNEMIENSQFKDKPEGD